MLASQVSDLQDPNTAVVQHKEHRDRAWFLKAFLQWNIHQQSIDIKLPPQDPNMAIVQHPEHKDLYATDPIARGFEGEVLTVMLDTVGENLSTDGFRCAEVGAGTGGFTRQVSHSAPSGF
jgi:hypothetical protein